MQECDKDKFLAAAQQEYRLGAERVAEFDKHIFLAMKRLTAGIAREIVDTSRTAGEAWYRLTDRFYGMNVQGATAHCQSTPRVEATYQVVKSFHLLNVIRKLVREKCSTVSKRTDIQRHRQSGLYESGPRVAPQSAGNTG